MGIFNMFKKTKKSVPNEDQIAKVTAESGDYKGITLEKKLNSNIQTLQTIFKDCDDVIFRPFKIAGRINAELVFIDGAVRIDAVERMLLSTPRNLSYPRIV